MKAVVWGLGRHGGGAAAARFLLRRGADVTVLDRRPAETLEGGGLPDGCDVVGGVDDPTPWLGPGVTLVVNPAVPPSHAAWPAVRASGCRVTSEFALQCEALAGRRVFAVTGSNGKSTAAAWAAALLGTDVMGGNFECGLVGLPPLLDRAADLSTDAAVVLEVSSFQLARIGDGLPDLEAAAVTGVTPNHLDWHPSLTEYHAAKRHLLKACGGRRLVGPSVPDEFFATVGRVERAEPAGPADWPADVRQAAGLAAALAGAAAGDARLAETRPRLPHGRRVVAEVDGVAFVDDSAATTPEAAAAALAEYGPACVLIAGGRSKGLDVDAFARAVAGRCEAVAAVGEAGSELASRVAVHGGKVRSHRTLAKAVKWASKVCPEGGAVVLSPGMASTDQFADYRERGRAFAEAAGQFAVRGGG